MTAKDFFTGFFYLPARAFSTITDLVLGSYKRKDDGSIKEASKEASNTNPGLLGFVFESVMYIARGISNFIYNHQTAIAAAFWASLVLSGAAALTVFLWPAALTAVATFSIYGLSIAAIVGTEAAAQIGAIAALTFAVTSVATYAIAAVVNTINWIKSCCTKTNPDENKGKQFDLGNEETKENEDTKENEATNSSAKKMAEKLGTPTPFTQVQKEEKKDDTAPVTGVKMFGKPKGEQVVEQTVEQTVEQMSKPVMV
ncbi:hypothetical protein [Legionella fallonii]|uniref:Transmembrane protein n=1 Tax=Legionella fallonii LLAP-10 TaxID=1212491 RepID=A0A098G8X2_9GAMM|nr:hypothetical protein [Legionella fallonii]CEG58944.1 conserved membrane protein of unknown function [Legionella fallonii LLAP-10]